MNVVIIGNFFLDSNNSRVNLAYRYFKENFTTKVIYSDFNHAKKENVTYDNLDLIPIKTLKYRKNISFKRIISHIKFAVKATKALKNLDADLVYVNIPPNILGCFVVRYCKRNNIKVIVDTVDLWPEAFPVKGVKKYIMMYTINPLWKLMRGYCLKNSTCNIAESDYFIKKFLKKYKVELVNLSKMDEEYEKKVEIEKNEFIKIGYLGAISNIYDFESLLEILLEVNKKRVVLLEIIGDGEKRNWLISKLKELKIDFKYYGKIFDENKKNKIMQNWTFGFNGYKNSTEVALSYKSLDYLSNGIPLINSTKGDTYELVDKFNIGINYTSNDTKFVVNEIVTLNKEKLCFMKKKSREIFEENFSWNIYRNRMNEIIKTKIVKNK